MTQLPGMVPISPVNAAKTLHASASVFGSTCSFLIDTGAAVTLLSWAVYERCPSPSELCPLSNQTLVSVNGAPLAARGSIQTSISINGVPLSASVVVVDGLTSEAILGLDFLQRHHCTIDTESWVLLVKSVGLRVPLCPKASPAPPNLSVSVVGSTMIPPQSEMEVLGRVGCDTPMATQQTWLLEGSLPDRSKAAVARSLVTIADHNHNVVVRVVNPSDQPVALCNGATIAELHELESDAIQVATTVQAPAQQIPEAKRHALWEMAQKADSLSDSEKQTLYETLMSYEDVFAADSSDLGRTGLVHHSVNTGPAAPVRQPPRRLPPHYRERAQELISDMLQRDIIQKSTSPWASPIVLVKKKDGTLRFCADYRKVNELTRRDAYPLPRVNDMLDTLAGSKWFTTLDLLSGYWQVELKKDDREKTAFCTQEGLFEFKVMPFGLSNAPATFQRLMDLVLAGLQWSHCLVYLDDVIVLGRSFEDHLSNLCLVFQRFRNAHLKIKPSKCELLKKEVCFLGHLVSEEGVATDPSKTAKVASWPTPTSCRQVQQFLGIANYYRRFVKNFAIIAKPLIRLTEKNCIFRWSNECQVAFDTLRQKLTPLQFWHFRIFQSPSFWTLTQVTLDWERFCLRCKVMGRSVLWHMAVEFYQRQSVSIV